MSEEIKLNLYQKISAVMKDVEYLSKDDEVEFGKTKYRAITEEKVTATVRASLIKHGLVVLPIKQVHTRDGNLSTVDVDYKIVDIDTGEHEIIVSSGTGADTQDKGVGKAMTYSYKYLFLRTFAIPTGEDPDKISSAELDEKQRIEREKKEAAEAKLLKDIEMKWKVLSGSTDGMEAWVEGLKQKGHTLQQMHELLAKRLIDKQKEE
ncbi:ERF family protein [Paenibacillus sp. CMAA1739]|uniref:ERF family protein n=1 Tax=Paenibacillus ottowii TaxID=2315729 RepID=UPI002DB9BA6F|nr:ERF family protein [Paenibacillus sp. CMAA1739]MEC4569472.1 ERF family protein [Paenibacillus sp. CMAA1739]